MNYNELCYIEINKIDVCVTRGFINGTNIKYFMDNKIDIFQQIKQHIVNNMKEFNLHPDIIPNLDMYIEFGIYILDNLYNNENIFYQLTRYLKINSCLRISNISNKFGDKYHTLPNQMIYDVWTQEKYCILSSIVDILKIDMRILHEDKVWINVMLYLHSQLLDYKKCSPQCEHNLINRVLCSLKQYTIKTNISLKTFLPYKNNTTLYSDTFNNTFSSLRLL